MMDFVNPSSDDGFTKSQHSESGVKSFLYWPLRKRIIPKLEKNVYAFHEWCLKKNILIGIICIIYSVIVFLVLRKLSFLNNLKG